MAGLIALAAAAAPLLAAVTWVLDGADGPIARRDPQQVPAFVAEESTTSDHARTLVLNGTSGHITYALVRGSGVRIGDAELAAGTLHPIPQERHGLLALSDAVVLLTAVND